MINLPVSEAYAFDYLSILRVKSFVPLPGAHEEYSKCRDELAKQLGWDTVCAVIRSWEYSALETANMGVWNMVAKAAKDECKASEVDAANQRRFKAKKDLQERFWPTEALSEVKAARP